jgi:hypothetical protein
VKDAQVIVVATPLDSAPAPPRRPGDLPEFTIRFRVVRVLKGQPADMVIMTRTLTAPDEFLGKDWILLLSPDSVAGKHSYAECLTIKAELEVQAILAQGLKYELRDRTVAASLHLAVAQQVTDMRPHLARRFQTTPVPAGHPGSRSPTGIQ